MDLEEYEQTIFYSAIKPKEGVRLVFMTPNRTVLLRVKTVHSKEPFTIHWIRGMKPGATLLDVGANIGLYSLYAAGTRSVRVFSFEPESQNYGLLNQNIHANQLSRQVTAFCCALSDHVGLGKLYLSEFATGGSCHSLDEEVGFDLRHRPAPYVQGCMSWTIDHAVASGAIDLPAYIKIDVDGFEHKVIEGALETLSNPAVKELLIEINPHLPDHLKMVDRLTRLGFVHDRVQTLMAARQEGAFVGVGEWIFKRYQPSERTCSFPHQPFGAKQESADSVHALAWQHALDRISSAEIQDAPFAYAVIDQIFPADYYLQIQANFPSDGEMIPLNETGRVGSDSYRQRKCVLFDEESFARLDQPRRMFWEALAQQLFSSRFILGVMDKFMPHIAQRLEVARVEGDVSIWGDALIVSDRTHYAIGPHTDAPHRLLTFLFYLPEDDSLVDCGTSIYQPSDAQFNCPGGVHHQFEGFERVKTVGFMPNRLLVFAKDENSFHGVETLRHANLDRRLVIYNVRLPVLQ